MVDQPGSPDRIARLAKVLVWPLIALVAIFVFREPLIDQFRAGNISTVKLGILELHMRDTDSLPVVTDSNVAKGLVRLPEAGVVALLFITQEGGYTQCEGTTQSAEDFDREYTRPFDDLETRGLAQIERTTGDDGSRCLGLTLTDQGTTARKFITDLIAAQLKTATAGTSGASS